MTANVPAAWRGGGLYPLSSLQRSKDKDKNNFHSMDFCLHLAKPLVVGSVSPFLINTIQVHIR